MKNQPKALLFGTCLAVAGMMLSPGRGMAQVTLSNGGSVASINPNSSAGMDSWTVPGSSQNQLESQWFYFSVNGGTVQSINALTMSPLVQPSADTATLMYSDSQLSISITYLLQGTGMGSANMTESIAVDNTSGSTFNLNLFEYSNFNLLQSGNNTASVIGDPTDGYSQVTQNSGTTAISQSISSPFANYAEAGPGGSGAGTVLADVTSKNNLTGPLTYTGNAAWAFQWSASLAPVPNEFDELGNGSLSITNVPEPTTFALIGVGLGVVGLVRRRRLS
jgi:hypothetical protein